MLSSLDAAYRPPRSSSGTDVPLPARPPSITVTTAAGSGAARPGAPTAVTLGRRTENSVGLSWTAPPGADRAVRYAVYEGETRVATSSDTDVVVRGLFHDTAHEFTAAAVDADGNESAHSAAVATTTLVCQVSPPAPVRVRATVHSASSVALSWVAETTATEFTVFDGSTAVLSTLTPSAAVTGLASASRHRFRVAGYRVYEGATVVASGPATTARVLVTIPTTHRWSVTAVDAAGNESVQSAPVTFTMPIITPPFP